MASLRDAALSPVLLSSQERIIQTLNLSRQNDNRHVGVSVAVVFNDAAFERVQSQLFDDSVSFFGAEFVEVPDGEESRVGRRVPV